jgi:hypothetical protein
LKESDFISRRNRQARKSYQTELIKGINTTAPGLRPCASQQPRGPQVRRRSQIYSCLHQPPLSHFPMPSTSSNSPRLYPYHPCPPLLQAPCTGNTSSHVTHNTHIGVYAIRKTLSYATSSTHPRRPPHFGHSINPLPIHAQRSHLSPPRPSVTVSSEE